MLGKQNAVAYLSSVRKAVIQSLPLVATIGFLVWVARSVFGRATKMSAGGPGGIFSVGKSKAK
jgi:hypothetical protein